MALFLRIDINIVAIILVAIILFTAYQRLDKTDRMNKSYLWTSSVVLVELCFETITCILNHRPESWVPVVSTVLHICLFAVAPLLAYSWYYLVCRWIMPGEFSTKIQKALFLPVIFNAVLTFLSPLYHFVFFIDSSDTYHRGSLFLLSALITYLYFFFALLRIIQYRNKVVKEDFIPLIIFGTLPFIGGILQAAFYGILLMWSGAGFSLVIVFIFLQQRMIQIDDLTEAWTRGSFESYMEKQSRLKENKTVFGLIFADIDGLKAINDQYGHAEGDFLLKTAVQLMKKEIGNTDIVVRYGGDEFILMLNCDSKDRLNKIVENIREACRRFNENSGKAYSLECSFGADLFCSNFDDIELMLRHVDMLMYSEKKLKKENAFMKQ